MGRTKIGLKGIVRNVPESTVKDGACEEIVNMRYRDEAWRPIVKYGTTNGADVGDYEMIWIHKGNDYTNYLGYKNGVTYWFDPDTGEVLQEIEVGEEIDSVQFVGNTANFIGGENIFSALFNENEYHLFQNIELPALDVSVVTEDEDGKQKVVGGQDEKVNDSINIIKVKEGDVDETRKFRDTVKGLYGKASEEANREGWFEGFCLLRYAFKLYDGSYYYYSPPLFVQSFNERYLDATAVVKRYVPGSGTYGGGAGGYGGYWEEIEFSYEKIPSVFVELENDSILSVVLRMGKIKVQIKDFPLMSSSLSKVFKSVDVFMTKPLAGINFDKVFLEAEWHDNENWMVYEGVEDIEKKLLEEKLVFYRVSTIPAKDLQSGYSEFLEFDENDITSKPILTEGNSLMHGEIPTSAFSLNGRLVKGGIITRLFKGYGANYFSVARKSSGRYKILVQTILNISTTKVVNSDFTYVDELPLYLNPLISYPDTRAEKIEIYVEDTTTGKYIETYFDLKSSEYLNMAYYFNKTYDDRIEVPINNAKTSYIERKFPVLIKLNDNLLWKTTPNLDEVEGRLDNEVKTSNKVKISELNNPLVYPAKNTYQVGKGDIVGFTTNSVALSQGQFGQYPLFVFTTEGIWAMEQGSGDVLYKNVVPLNREVCNNAESITQLDRATAFTTEKGLMLLFGTEVKEISVPIEGEPEYLQNENATYAEAVGNDKLVQMVGNHSAVSFKEYLAGAKMGYDYLNKELVVSNVDYPYSYVYGLDSGVWHKTTEQYSQFVNNYPQTLGVMNGRMVDVSAEGEGFVPVLLHTKAIKFDTEIYKAMRRLILRGLLRVQEGKYAGFYVFGSYDAEKWAYLGGIQNKDDFRDMVAKTLRTDCKYFKIVFAGGIAHDSYVNYVELEVAGELQSRTR